MPSDAREGDTPVFTDSNSDQSSKLVCKGLNAITIK